MPPSQCKPTLPTAGLVANMNLDIQVETASDVAVQSNVAQSVSADANLRLARHGDESGAAGRIDITQGKLFFFGNKYTIDQEPIVPEPGEDRSGPQHGTGDQGARHTDHFDDHRASDEAERKPRGPILRSSFPTSWRCWATGSNAERIQRLPPAARGRSQNWQQMGAFALDRTGLGQTPGLVG